jgi:predicted DNA-binding transcriptional regulator AlpA
VAIAARKIGQGLGLDADALIKVLVMSTIDVQQESPALLIRADEFARLLDVSLRTLWRMRSAGELPEAVCLRGVVRWRRDLVESWVTEGCPALQSRENGRRRK